MTAIPIKVKYGVDQIEAIIICPNITVKELKENLTLKFNTETSYMKIIFQGKILKDIHVLQDVNVKADSILHLIITKQIEIKQQLEQAQQPSQQQAPAIFQQLSQQPLGRQQGRLLNFGEFGANNEMDGFGQMGRSQGFGWLGGFGGMGLDPYMMRKDPFFMMQLLQHPIYQAQVFKMMQNPQVRQQFMQIPKIAQLMQTNPQLQQIFDNPQLFQIMMNSQIVQMALFGVEGLSEAVNSLFPPNPHNVQTSHPILSISSENAQNPFKGFDLYSQMSMMGGGTEGAGGAQLTTEAAEEKYAAQLLQLQELGLANKQLNLEALIATRGNFDAAIDIIVKMLEP